MSIVNDWNEQALDHIGSAYLVRSIAMRRLRIMDSALQQLEAVYSHPEMIMQLNKLSSYVASTEELESLAKIIEKTVRVERVASSAALNDINKAAKLLYTAGYVVIPSQEYKEQQIEKKRESKGLSAESVDIIKRILTDKLLPSEQLEEVNG